MALEGEFGSAGAVAAVVADDGALVADVEVGEVGEPGYVDVSVF